jgi:putative phosphoesterase
VKIGVISDTHNLLDPQVPRLLAGVDHILHAGDIGQPQLLLELEQIAPVTAVRGNTDDPGLHYRLTEAVSLAGRKFLVHHIVQPHHLEVTLKERIAQERAEVVVFGHTHKPFCETHDGTLFFNPGYAGKPRFNLPRSLAILHCGARGIRPEFLPLDGR